MADTTQADGTLFNSARRTVVTCLAGFCLTACAGLASNSSIAASTAPQAADFIGTWRLVSWTAQTPGQAATYPMGADALGFIIYAADGSMSAHLAPNPEGAAAGGAEPPRAIAYSGGYDLTPDTRQVHHRVRIATIPQWIGTTLTRSYDFDNGRLTLSTPPASTGSTNALVWERLPVPR